MDRLSSASFFCPAYNDEGNLPDLIPAVHAFLSKHFREFEILILEDGSPDRTGAIADDLAKHFSQVRVVHHAKNQGYTATLREGFASARFEYVMYTDGDNQYDISDFEPYLGLIADHDLIMGYARVKAASRRRAVQSLVFNSLIAILFFSWYRDINCSMKMIRRDALLRIPLRSSPRGAFIDAELVLRAKRLGLRIAQFPVTHYARKSGIASGSKPSLVWETLKDLVRLRFGML
jgi:glycosyltransferase involved in cell wall biosynthesis